MRYHSLEVRAKAVLIDERHGRQEAKKCGLRVIGTLGVLTAAHELGMIDLIAALDSLRQTSFHISPKLLASIVLKYLDKQ
jgi:predicted nucleic acid-binding protein